MTGRLAAAVVVLAPIWAHGASVVYSNDFENSPGKEWSSDQTVSTPKGMKRFLGPFTVDRVALRLDKLPPHKYLRISFDLFIAGTWDGNALKGLHGTRIGPDTWRMNIAPNT